MPSRRTILTDACMALSRLTEYPCCNHGPSRRIVTYWGRDLCYDVTDPTNTHNAEENTARLLRTTRTN
eukprot:12891950-Prorocentrum_lima.AAC.1